MEKTIALACGGVDIPATGVPAAPPAGGLTSRLLAFLLLLLQPPHHVREVRRGGGRVEARSASSAGHGEVLSQQGEPRGAAALCADNVGSALTSLQCCGSQKELHAHRLGLCPLAPWAPLSCF